MRRRSHLILILLPVICLFAFTHVSAQVAAGGDYALSQTVIGGGGASSGDAGGTYTVNGTSGQPAAGTASTGGLYSTLGGFWVSPLAPTAAGANISGRVLGIDGAGLRNVGVTLTGGNLTTPRYTVTNVFGHFSFDDVEVGHVYVITVHNKKYGFAQNSQVFSVFENVSGIVFQAGWEN